MNSKIKLTSIKLLEILYNQFKKETVDNKMTLQRLVNRTMHKYVTDSEFRKMIYSTDVLITSGSGF